MGTSVSRVDCRTISTRTLCLWLSALLDGGERLLDPEGMGGMGGMGGVAGSGGDAGSGGTMMGAGGSTPGMGDGWIWW